MSILFREGAEILSKTAYIAKTDKRYISDSKNLLEKSEHKDLLTNNLRLKLKSYPHKGALLFSP